MIRKALLVAALALSTAIFGGATPSAFAADEINTVPGLTTAGAPLALHGYDPVAYFKDGKPVQADGSIAVAHGGAAYYFASEANKAAFVAEPAKYLPQFGGHCAYGVSVGKKFDGNPLVWKIVDDKLYLNLNPEIAKTFAKDVPGNIKKADTNWKTIAGKSPASL